HDQHERQGQTASHARNPRSVPGHLLRLRFTMEPMPIPMPVKGAVGDMLDRRSPESDPAYAFAEFSASLTFEQLPAEVVAVLKRIVLDTLGTTLAGTTLGSGVPELVEVVHASGGVGPSTVIGHGHRTSAPMAALANGALAHALNYDDVYPGG